MDRAELERRGWVIASDGLGFHPRIRSGQIVLGHATMTDVEAYKDAAVAAAMAERCKLQGHFSSSGIVIDTEPPCRVCRYCGATYDDPIAAAIRAREETP